MSRRGRAAPARRPTVAQLHAEIRQTRADLAGTLQVLAARADLRARARGEAIRLGERVAAAAVRTQAGGLAAVARRVGAGREAYLPVGVLLGIGAVVIAGVLVRHGRRG
jgi:hypothetical protein